MTDTPLHQWIETTGILVPADWFETGEPRTAMLYAQHEKEYRVLLTARVKPFLHQEVVVKGTLVQSTEGKMSIRIDTIYSAVNNPI